MKIIKRQGTSEGFFIIIIMFLNFKLMLNVYISLNFWGAE